MPTGTFGGFPFDKEVYGSFVDQQPTFSDNIIASGILASDPAMTAMLDNGGTVGTTRFYNPLDPDTDAPIVRDGTNDNTPSTVAGGKQSFIRIDRMKAWKANQLVRELTAANPMQNVASKTGLYWRMYWQGLMVNTAESVLGLSGLSDHITTSTDGVDGNLLIDAQQKALGDFYDKFGLLVMHSKILAAYQKLGLVNYNKYVITNVLQKEVELPTINGLVVVVNDRGTHRPAVTANEAQGISAVAEAYKCFLFGQGSILTDEPTTTTPDYADYDPKTGGGTDLLYNTRSRILHPNGVSFKADNITGETPTDTEFTTTANWDLRFNHKNVRLGEIIIPASQL